MSEEIVGLVVEGQIVVGHGASQVGLIEAGQRSVDVEVGILGQQVDGLVEELLALLPFAAGQTDDGTLSPDIAVVGVELDTLLEGLDGLRGVFLHDVGLGLHGRNAGITAPPLAHGVELGQGQFVVFLLNAAEGAVVPQVDALGIVAQGGIIVADGSVEILLLDAAESAQLVDAHHVGIALDGLGAVALGSDIVVEVVFRHSAEIPRLIHIGLGRDGLVEILDGQHVVLEIECRASNGYQPVGVELGKTS